MAGPWTGITVFAGDIDQIDEHMRAFVEGHWEDGDAVKFDLIKQDVVLQEGKPYVVVTAAYTLKPRVRTEG